MVADVLSLLAQISALIVWPILDDNSSLWLLPVALILVSVGWWENFVSSASLFSIFKILARNKVFKSKRYFVYIFVSICKAAVFFITTILIIVAKEGDAGYIFDEFEKAFQSHEIIITEVRTLSYLLSTSDKVSNYLLRNLFL